jgi:hypothetical protein
MHYSVRMTCSILMSCSAHQDNPSSVREKASLVFMKASPSFLRNFSAQKRAMKLRVPDTVHTEKSPRGSLSIGPAATCTDRKPETRGMCPSSFKVKVTRASPGSESPGDNPRCFRPLQVLPSLKDKGCTRPGSQSS